MIIKTAFPIETTAQPGVGHIAVCYDADVRTPGTEDHDHSKPARLDALEAWFDLSDPLWGGPNIPDNYEGPVLGNFEETFRHDKAGFGRWCKSVDTLFRKRFGKRVWHVPYYATGVEEGEPHTPYPHNAMIAAKCRFLSACCYVRYWINGDNARDYPLRSMTCAANLGKPWYALICLERIQAYVTSPPGAAVLTTAVRHESTLPEERIDYLIRCLKAFRNKRGSQLMGAIIWNATHLHLAQGRPAWEGGPKTQGALARIYNPLLNQLVTELKAA